MPNKTALCIGINNYPGTANDLSGCVNDVKDWSAELTKRGFTVKTLLDAKATKANIVKGIKSLLTATGPGDSVVIQFSGHGSYVPDENGDEPDEQDECICPYDIATADGSGNYITDDELFQLYSLRHKDSRLVILSDSCHSGTVAKAGPVLSIGGLNRKIRFLAPEEFLSQNELSKFGDVRNSTARSASPPGRYAGLLMAGCRDKEFSYDAEFNQRPNGAFTYAALTTLKKLKAAATYADWYKEIRKALPSQDYPQTPNLFGSSVMKSWKVLS